MKKSVLIAIILVAIAIILLLYFKVFSGYASWVHQSQSTNNSLNACEDSDSGKNYDLGGTAKWTFRGKTYEYKDFCSFGLGTRLTEYYCTKENVAAPISYNCAMAGKRCIKGTDGAYCG